MYCSMLKDIENCARTAGSSRISFTNQRLRYGEEERRSISSISSQTTSRGGSSALGGDTPHKLSAQVQATASTAPTRLQQEGEQASQPWMVETLPRNLVHGVGHLKTTMTAQTKLPRSESKTTETGFQQETTTKSRSTSERDVFQQNIRARHSSQ